MLLRSVLGIFNLVYLYLQHDGFLFSGRMGKENRAHSVDRRRFFHLCNVIFFCHMIVIRGDLYELAGRVDAQSLLIKQKAT